MEMIKPVIVPVDLEFSFKTRMYKVKGKEKEDDENENGKRETSPDKLATIFAEESRRGFQKKTAMIKLFKPGMLFHS